MRRGVAIAGAVTAAGLATWWVYGRATVAPPRPPPRPSAEVEVLPIPDGVSGGATHVAARDPVRATCWGDGSVTIRRGVVVARVAPPGDGARFRRVAVARDGVVFALSTRGALVDVSASPPRRTAVKVQAGASIAAGGTSDDLWLGGESGALVRVIRPGETVVRVDDGDPSITALASGAAAGHDVAVGRADGTVTLVGSAPERRESLGAGVVALADLGRTLVAADERGRIRHLTERGSYRLGVRNSDRTIDGVSDRAVDDESGSGAVVAMLAIRSTSSPEAFAIVRASGTLSAWAFGEHGWGREYAVDLDARPHGVCAIEEGAVLLVATDAGERIVRFVR